MVTDTVRTCGIAISDGDKNPDQSMSTIGYNKRVIMVQIMMWISLWPFAEGEYQKLSDGVLSRCGMGEHTTREGLQYYGSWADDKMNGKGEQNHLCG